MTSDPFSSPEIYFSSAGDQYTLEAATVRTGGNLEGLGKDSFHATDEEIAAAIQRHLTSHPYSTATYNCHDWAREALQAAGLGEAADDNFWIAD